MIKIVHIITGLGQGGAETMLYNLLLRLDKTKFKITVISMMDEGVFGKKIKMLGIPLYCLHMPRGKMALSHLHHYCRLIKSIQPHIVQAWMYHANFFSAIARPFLPRHKIYFNVRVALNNLKKEKKKTYLIAKFNALLSHLVTGVINNSRVSQAQHDKIGFSKKNAIYIGNGFDIHRLRPSPQIYSEFRKEKNYPPETKIVAMFARFYAIKNQDGFLEMAKILKDKFSTPVLFLMGGTNVDRHNKKLMTKIDSLGLTEHVLLLGNVDVALYLAATDVVVLPSFREGFPNILGEAMACGVPCVATDVGDTRYILSDYGYTTEVNDVTAWAEYVSKILLLSPQAYQTLSNKCVQHIMQNHDISTVAKQYENLYLQHGFDDLRENFINKI